MNTLSFEFESREIRTSLIDGEVWFLLVDVLKALESKTTVTAAKSSINSGLGDGYVSNKPIRDTGNRMQNADVAHEAAVTYLVANGRTEKGRQLNRYIHGTLLPNLRRSGALDKPHMPIEVIFETISIRADTAKAKAAMTMARQQCDDMGDLLGNPLRTKDDVVNSLGAHIFIRALSHFVNPIRNGSGLSEADIMALESLGLKDIDRLHEHQRQAIPFRRR